MGVLMWLARQKKRLLLRQHTPSFKLIPWYDLWLLFFLLRGGKGFRPVLDWGRTCVWGC